MKRCGFVLAVALVFAITPARAGERHAEADIQFRIVLDHVRAERLDAALAEIERLLSRYPNFRLGHLVRGDLLLGRLQRIEGMGQASGASLERLEEWRAEAMARLRGHDEHAPPKMVPRYLLQLDASQKHAVVVDAGRSRVYLYENEKGRLRLVADYYTSIGKRGMDKLREGDQKTPLGVYHVTSMIPGRKLPDLYGWGAFPINYPNEWDRLRGRTGFGIWLHGVPADTYSRAPWASDGCIAMANPDIEELGRRMEAGLTPVIISERVAWLSEEEAGRERDAFLARIDAWRRDWESRDPERYLAHYASDFRSDTMDRAAWGDHKRRVGAAKRWIKISLANVAVLGNPGRRSMVQVTFDQDYRSDQLSQRSRKRQYWIEEGGQWRIAYEAPAVSKPRVRLPESYPGT